MANAEFRKCIIKTKYAHIKFKLFSSSAIDNDFYNFSKKMQTFDFHLTRYQCITNIKNSIQINIKLFCNNVNSLKKLNSTVSDYINYNNLFSFHMSEIVNLFVNFFSSVYITDHL